MSEAMIERRAIRPYYYGFRNDPAYDNATAFQNALNDAAGSGVQGVPKYVDVPQGIYYIKSPIFVPSWVALRGASARGTVIINHPDFGPAGPSIYGGLHDNASVFGCRVEDIWLDCNRVAGSTGYFSNQLNELCGLKRFTVTRYMDTGIRIIGAPPIIGGYNYLLEDIELAASETATGTFGIDLQALVGAFVYGKISRVTVVPNGTGKVGTSGIRLTGAGEQAAWLDDIHVENHTNGIHFDTNSLGTATGVTAGGASGTDQAINIDTGRPVVIQGVRGTTTTHLIVDTPNGVTVDGSRYGHYSNTELHANKLQLRNSNATQASFNIPHGLVPTSPVDGDIWTTSGGLYVRINGVTVGPLS